MFFTAALDLLQAMLTFNPNDRASAEEAIRHPYLKIYSCASDEPQELDPFHVEYEVDNLSPVTLRKMIFSESKFRTEANNQPPLNSLELSATNDSEDDYKWKLEMLSFSPRDNSDLDSEEEVEEKLDSDKTSLKLTPDSGLPGKEENNEKSENEASEKSHEDGKEHKLLLWEQEMAARSSSKNVQEKGATESDGEYSEKSESEDAKSEKEEDEDDTVAQTEQDLISDGESSEKNDPKFDKNAILKTTLTINQMGEKHALKTKDPAKEDELRSDLSEKSIDDKLQKEKCEENPSDVSIQSARRKEQENKDLHDVHAPILANNKVLYDEEKTIQKCLEKSCKLEETKDSLKNAKVSPSSQDSNGPGNLTVESFVLPSQVASKDRLSQAQRSRVRGYVDSMTQERSLPRPTGFDEELFVDIPRNPGILSGSPRSPPRTEGDRYATVQSPRSRGSNSPREKSVRPKKQDWFYMHKGSNH